MHLGLNVDYERIIEDPRDLGLEGLGLREGLAGLAVTFDNREYFAQSPGVGRGSFVRITAESNDVIASDYEGNIFQGQWQHTFDLPGRQSVSWDVAVGQADREAEPFRLGGTERIADQLLFGRDELSLVGYRRGTEIGHLYHRERLSYGRWLGRVERNWGLTPFGLGDISGRVFVESGAAWFRNQSSDPINSVGVELTVELILGYRLPLPVNLGLAEGLDKDRGGETQAYFNVSIPL